MARPCGAICTAFERSIDGRTYGSAQCARRPDLPLAEAAGAAIMRAKWQSGPSSCHGLPGDADFLLDLADFTGERRFHDRAAELATATDHVKGLRSRTSWGSRFRSSRRRWGSTHSA